MCQHGDALVLYERYCNIFVDYINDTVLPSLREKHDEPMLRELVKSWKNYEVMAKGLSRNFEDLDKVVTHNPVPGLNEVEIMCFRDLIYKEFNVKFCDAALSLIDKERKGGQIDRNLLQNVLNIFVAMGMNRIDYYEADFELAFLEDTSSYYSLKASTWILKYSFPVYMLKVEDCLKQEKNRVSHYLQLSSKPKLLEKVRNELLSVHATQLLMKEDSGFFVLLNNVKVEDLSRMCRLFSKLPKGLNLVSDMLKERVENEGLALVKQVEDAAINNMDFVKGLTELHDKYLPRVIACFPKHTLFQKAFEEAFAFVCNKSVGGCSFSELLATLCDDILKRGGTEKVNDVAIEDTQEKVVKLVALRSDKQLFAELYRIKLAGRLLFDKSAKTEHEESMLTKLKQQCNREFTYKMEGMVKDMTLAKETQSSFEEYLENNPNVNPGIDLTVRVLTSEFWPSYNSININLPDEMRKCVEVFGEFYQRSTENRNLTWINSVGTCEILGNFEPKTIELIVTTCQASVLLLFNSCDRLSYQDIASQLNLSHDDVVPLLHSLSCAKYKILTKEPNTETISSTDNFVLNSNFTDNRRKIKIPLPQSDEEKNVTEDVVKKRRYAIDAAIVRIMKSLKILEYQQLTVECVEQLRAKFEPDKTEIKQCVENLIERSYVERDANNAELLRYLV